MFHGLNRRVYSSHVTDFARPEAAAIDNMFRVDLSFWCCYVPTAIRALLNGGHRCVGVILGTMHPRGLGKGIGCTGRIEITILVIPQGGVIVLWVNQGVPLSALAGRNELLMQAHIARLGTFPFQIVIPFGLGRRRNPVI